MRTTPPKTPRPTRSQPQHTTTLQNHSANCVQNVRLLGILGLSRPLLLLDKTICCIINIWGNISLGENLYPNNTKIQLRNNITIDYKIGTRPWCRQAWFFRGIMEYGYRFDDEAPNHPWCKSQIVAWLPLFQHRKKTCSQDQPRSANGRVQVTELRDSVARPSRASSGVGGRLHDVPFPWRCAHRWRQGWEDKWIQWRIMTIRTTLYIYYKNSTLNFEALKCTCSGTCPEFISYTHWLVSRLPPKSGRAAYYSCAEYQQNHTFSKQAQTCYRWTNAAAVRLQEIRQQQSAYKCKHL